MKQEHLEIEEIYVYTDGGLVIIFTNGSHTFIPGKKMKKILEEYNHINLDEPF